MKLHTILFIVSLLQFNLFANEQQPEKTEIELWSNGKITPEQPFKAKIIAAGGLTPWSSETVIYMREDGPKKRYLEVRVGFAKNGITYKVITQKSFNEIITNMSGYGASVYLDPVKVSQFVWVSPLGDIGKKLEETDLVKQAYLFSLKVQSVD